MSGAAAGDGLGSGVSSATTAIDIDTLTDEAFAALPLVIRGESKEVRYAGRGMVVIRFLPTINSYTQNRCVVVEGSDVLRLQADRILVKVLEANGIQHSYRAVNERFAYSRLVLPHPVEFAKYGLPEFHPPDLTEDEVAALPRAPPIEVIIKCFHGGTSKHRYRSLQTTRVRQSHHLFRGMPIRVDAPYPEPLVRFDWRNPLTMAKDPFLGPADPGAKSLCERWLSELPAAKGDFGGDFEYRRIKECLTSAIDPATVRVPDEILPEPLADLFIDVARARQTALGLYHTLQTFLDSCDIICYDLCLFISEDGGLVYGEISQDCGRFRHFDLGSLDKDVWRAGGSSTQVLAKWQKFAELLEAGWQRAGQVPLRYAVPRLTDELLTLYLGTTNPYKISEIAAMVQHLNVTLVPTEPFDIEEPYSTFTENARTKALAYAEHTGGITIAEDSGLSVEALGGLPGPWSARLADFAVIDVKKGVDGGLSGYEASGRPRDEIDRANFMKVLDLMKGQVNRKAALHIALCVARPGEVLYECETVTSGSIAEEPRGANGFGYDPIFVGDDTYGATYAELDPCRKNLRSHRRKACRELARWIAEELRSDTPTPTAAAATP